MSVRKRKWQTRSGDEREAWLVDYTDAEGNRKFETFAKKKDADAFHDKVRQDVRQGTHVSTKLTVKEAGQNWLAAAEKGIGRDGPLERATIRGYKDVLDRHIVPHIGKTKLANLDSEAVKQFEQKLLDAKCSRDTIKRALANLGAILAEAGAPRNAVRDRPRYRSSGRGKKPLKVGVDIPTPDEARAIIHGATGRWRPLLVTAIFTGLRASELRGLTWKDVDFTGSEIHITQRADRFNDIGAPKSESSQRTVPMPKFVANTLREWKLKCPKGDLGLVFPTGKGNIEDLGNIIHRGLVPAQIAAGVVDATGKPRYTGMHCLRHYYASWCINRVKDGGLGLPPKIVQTRLGHSKLAMTMDTYGHLFKGDDADEMDAAVDKFMAVN